MNRLLLAVCAASLLGGCYRTTVRNGSAAAQAATVEYDGKWHSGLIYGIAELSGPYDLSRICPQGWADVHTETSFLNGLVTGITGNIYTPQSVTIHCAAK